MNVTLSMFSTTFFRPSASNAFTFSLSAFDSSPSTMRPSSATTDTPFTSRLVIFNATFVSSSIFGKPILDQSGVTSGGNRYPEPESIPENQKKPVFSPPFGAPGPGSLNIVRAGHVISAPVANQFAPARFEPLRAHRTIAQSVLAPQLGSC